MKFQLYNLFHKNPSGLEMGIWLTVTRFLDGGHSQPTLTPLLGPSWNLSGHCRCYIEYSTSRTLWAVHIGN